MFIREDLTVPQQIVQTAHAVDEIGRRHQSVGNNYMVLCSANDERGLFEISDWLKDNLIDHEMFFEPDIDSHTAIATRPLTGEERNCMKRFKLKRA
jgi:hypothetical protein